ncbi:MAG: beta-galactosidase [Ruminococcus sp.]|nr:beta-galactosidase [Ruminococcus sp.]
MKIGVDYYPEQWDGSLWRKDAELMLRTGVKIVRIADCAWSRIEVSDGEFDFGWLDDIVNIFENYGLEIIFCVPTSCPPLWLYESYPEILKVGADGKRVQTGIRSHRCINSPVFLAYAKRLAENLVRRYGHRPSVIAWQIDNELEAYQCTCDVCRNKFRDWLIDKHETLENINNAFGTSVWSGEYSDISQINPPNAYPLQLQNPALCLEYTRFSADCTSEYVKEIALAIRREVPKTKVTTNTWVCGNAPDYYKLFDNLDFVSYDNYPSLNNSERNNPSYSHSFWLDLMRGIKDENFWITEQLSGIVGGWQPMSPSPKPGMIMGYALQAFAHGAETVIHFRWRTALKGAEMFLHGLIDHSNVPSRRFFEFSELCKTASRLNDLVSSRVVSDIALLYSPDCYNALRIQPQTENFDYMEQLKYFHTAFARYGANIDVISAEADLSAYKLVVAPSLFVGNRTVSENIYRFVINGGTVVLTARSGVKDSNNNCIMEALPTVYTQLIGAEVTEYDPTGCESQTITDFAGNIYKCREWCDIMKLTTAKVYAEYGENFYRCCPAVTMNRYCNGTAYYVGTVADMDFYESFAGNLMVQAKIPRLKGLPKGVEVITRKSGINEYIFFFNNSEETVMINLPKVMYSLIDSRGKDVIRLIPFDVDIVRK